MDNCRKPCNAAAPLLTGDPNSAVAAAMWLAYSRQACDINRSACEQCIDGAIKAGVIK